MKAHKKISKKQSPKKELDLSPAKKRIFTIILLAIPIVVLALFEIGLRLGNYGGDTRLFVSKPNESSPYLGLNENVGSRYFHRDSFLPTPRKDLFLKKKPENGYRIFVLGGSTTAGFPYGNNLTFPRILHRRLANAFPEKHIEVVNCAFTAINSYTLLDFMDEILKQQPDLLLVYAGHNEYYGALGAASMESVGRQRWFVKVYLQLQHLKMFLWLRNSITDVRAALFARDVERDPTRTIMSRIVKNKSIPFGSKLYKKGLNQFRGNMQEIINKADKAGVPIVLSQVVSNIRDHEPFISVTTPESPSAKNVYNQAQTLEREGEFEQAKTLYYNAKDYDALRFRASEDLNIILNKLAETNELPLVPMQHYFEANSPHGLVGNNLMWEHLHPKRSGYFLMAEAFFNVIRGKNLIGDWSEVKTQPSQFYEQTWGFSKLDSVYADLAILQLKGSWPFVPEGTPNRFMLQFEPKTVEEQIVYNILSKAELTLEQGHLQLAGMYEKNGDYAKAIQEYKALIYTVPTLDLFYQPMIQLLLKLDQHKFALQVLYDALHFQDSAFVYKWIGQIYLALDDTKRGIRYLDEAIKRDPDDPQTIYNITRAYYAIGAFKNGDAYMVQLRRMINGTEELQNLVEFREVMWDEYRKQG